MDELIDGSCVGHVFVDGFLAPMRPIVRLKNNLGVGEQRLCLGDVASPAIRIPHLRAAQRVEIVHASAAVFRHPEGFAVGEIGIHFGGRFRSRRLLEDSGYAINGCFINRIRNLEGRRDIADTGLHCGQANAHRKASLFAIGKHGAVLEKRPPLHCRAHKDIFLHYRVRKAFRHNNCGLSGCNLLVKRQAAIRSIFWGNQPFNAAVVIHMRMADDNGDNPRIAHLGAEKFQRFRRGIFAAAAVHDDPSVFAADEGNIGNIIAAHLVDAVSNLKETVNVV